MDLRTPENIVEAAFRAIRDGKTGYCPNAGIPELREALAADVGAARGVDYGPQHVAVQPGGKPVIEKFLLTLMDPGDEVLYPSPGFPIYESQIEFLGGVAKPYGFVPGGKNFLLDFDAIEAAITPRTKLLIFNNLHNPTGAESPDEEIRGAGRPRPEARPVRAVGRGVLGRAVLRPEQVDRVAARHAGAHGHPLHLQQEVRHDGVATGRRDRSGGPHRAHRHPERQPGVVHDALHPVGRRRGAHRRPVGRGGDPACPRASAATWRSTSCNEIPGVSCYRPEATFYLFPDVTGLMERKGLETYDQLRRAALEQTGVSFCTRLHFGRALPGEDRRYVRLAYSGISAELIREGLGRLKEWAQ